MRICLFCSWLISVVESTTCAYFFGSVLSAPPSCALDRRGAPWLSRSLCHPHPPVDLAVLALQTGSGPPPLWLPPERSQCAVLHGRHWLAYVNGWAIPGSVASFMAQTGSGTPDRCTLGPTQFKFWVVVFLVLLVAAGGGCRCWLLVVVTKVCGRTRSSLARRHALRRAAWP